MQSPFSLFVLASLAAARPSQRADVARDGTPHSPPSWRPSAAATAAPAAAVAAAMAATLPSSMGASFQLEPSPAPKPSPAEPTTSSVPQQPSQPAPQYPLQPLRSSRAAEAPPHPAVPNPAHLHTQAKIQKTQKKHMKHSCMQNAAARTSAAISHVSSSLASPTEPPTESINQIQIPKNRQRRQANAIAAAKIPPSPLLRRAPPSHTSQGLRCTRSSSRARYTRHADLRQDPDGCAAEEARALD